MCAIETKGDLHLEACAIAGSGTVSIPVEYSAFLTLASI